MNQLALSNAKQRPKPSHLWKPGQSGNPSGRAKIEGNVQELARAHTAIAIEALRETIENKLHPQRITAASIMLDRAWGRAPQTVDVNMSTWDSMAYTERAMLARALEIIAAAGLDINGEGMGTTSPAIDITPTVVDAPVAPCADDGASAANPPHTDESTPKP